MATTVHNGSPSPADGDDHHGDEAQLYTDGACSGNPGPGGWGVVMRWRGHEKEFSGGEADTTNNRMEMMAVVMGLRALKRPMAVRIHTDSQYVHKGMTEWLGPWKRRGWKTADRQPVKNEDLWRLLESEVKRHTAVSWQWVRGHCGHPGNERADALARHGLARSRTVTPS